MNQNNQSVELLKAILPTLISAAQQHYVHATINLKKGFIKLGNRMMEEYTEETATVGKIIDRLIELDGTVELVNPEAQLSVYSSIEDQLRNECDYQFKSIALLEGAIRSTTLDLVTENFLTEYLNEETQHAAWLRQQVELMDTIGVKNYLSKQI